MRYNNYHKHDHKGNPWMVDVATKEYEYCQRAVELGHTTVFTTNHGVTGDIFTWMECAKEYNLKMIYGTEAYYVPNRLADADGNKDRSNRHIIIIAKNNSGAEQLNDIMTEAHQTGFYYRPRIDNELLFSLNPDDVIITSACVAGIWDNPELLMALKRHFKNNFFLEVQSHDFDLQKKVNSRLLDFSLESGIQIIHGNDSHYIYPEDAKLRDIFLRGNDLVYQDEHQMMLDYPDSDEIFYRYKQQGILNESQVQQALENTLVFDDCSEITLINTDIKLPSISDNPTQELRNIINERWKAEREKIPRERWHEYLEAIRNEVDVIEKTHMENYFLIDYKVAKNAQEKYNGRLTNTGRGSAPSFYVTKLLGLTDIDRLNSPITLFPHRFMSVERILGARSLPDIDLNCTDREPFIKATQDLLGAENCAWMIAWKPLQESSAFKTYCKGIGMELSEYVHITEDFDRYKDDPKWKTIIEESKKLVGVVRSISESPCSMLLYYKPIRKELGLVRTKDKMCCLLDGYYCDKYKYLKNDYLTVTVWAIIRDVCRLANIPIPTIKEFNQLLDDRTFDIYAKGLTSTINQADSDFATPLAMRYKPKSVSEMSAFVAIIRPGCASLLQDFIDRKPYSTNVPELDNLLIEGNHRMIYQELIMKYLIWLGIEETGSYDIIKKIAKKKFKEQELEELKGKLLKGWIGRVGSEDGFNETWTVVEQAAKYSFNASHSLSYAYDSLYGAYLKSHYPLEYYTVAFNYYEGDNKRTLKLTNELKYFNIKLKPALFRFSRSKYECVRSENAIYKGIASIKDLNSQVAEELYSLRDNQYNSFVDLLYDIKQKTTAKKNQINILINLDFFSEFGDANYLLKIYDVFLNLYNAVNISKDKLQRLNLPEELITPYAGKITEKTFSKVDVREFLNAYAQNVTYHKRTLHDKIKAQDEYLGYIDIADPRYNKMIAVLSVDNRYSPRIQAHSLQSGNLVDFKIDKRTFYKNRVSSYDVIKIIDYTKKQKTKFVNGVYEPIEGEYDKWLLNYEIIENL